MDITLDTRTEETAAIYFEKANTPQIRKTLPQKASTLEEALEDFRRTQLPGATSYGKTIWADGSYVGDIWCYCMDPEEDPNAMVSYCVFDRQVQNQGVATRAMELFLAEVKEKFSLASMGAFTFSANTPSIRVLEKNGFALVEEFTEDGALSAYFQRAL